MLPSEVYVFSEKKKDQTPMKTSCPGDAASQNASVTVSSKFHIQDNFKAPEMVQPNSDGPEFTKHLQLCIDYPAKTSQKRLSDFPGL